MRNSRKGNMLEGANINQRRITLKDGIFSETNSEDQDSSISRVSSNCNSEAFSVNFSRQPTVNDHSSRPSIDKPPPIPSSTRDYPSAISKSPRCSHVASCNGRYSYTGLMGSLIREEGHIYSLATSGDLLYTGSDSKNIRVWKSQKEISGFKSNSGLVKAIVIAGERIFTGHQDGKIRVWKGSAKNHSVYKRIGTLPSLKAFIKCSFSPSNYVEVSQNHSRLWIKHIDAISCLSLSEDKIFLYSASWDKTIKVWRVSNSKCLESILAHDDAVNAVVAGFDGLVFSGSADGTVKVWRRELQGKGIKHFFSQTLLKQECAVTAVEVNPSTSVLYCGSSDGLVNLWERNKLSSRGGILRGHKLAVLCLTTAGNLVFSGSADTNICVWRKEEEDHVCLALLHGHTGPVKCLAVQEELRPRCRNRQWVVYSGSLHKSVKIWNVPEDMTAMPSQQHNMEGYLLPQSFPSCCSFSSQGSRRSQRRKH